MRKKMGQIEADIKSDGVNGNAKIIRITFDCPSGR